MKKSVILLALFIAFGSQAVTPAFEQSPGMPPPPFMGKMHRPNFDLGQKLNLTEAQKQQAKQLREQSRAKIHPIFEQMKAERAKLAEMQKNNTPQNQLQTQTKKILELRKQAKAIHEQNMKEFEKILTPAQKSQFEKIKKERMKDFKYRPKLNLTEAQKEQARQLREQFRAKMQPLFEQMKAERAKFEELQKNNAAQDQLQAQKQKMHTLMEQVKAIHKQKMEAFKQILTPQQKAELEKNKKQRMEKFKGKGGMPPFEHF